MSSMLQPLIAIVGSTGVGKTSLARALCAAKPFTLGLEQHTGRPFQALLKSDSRYALANQVDYLLLRAEQERGLRQSTAPGLVDGGLDQDFHGFTRLFHQRGYLSDAEFDLCRRLYETLRLELPLPDRVIYLTASESAIRERLSRRERINIASAEDIALLNAYLAEWVDSLDPQRVIRLDVSAAREDYSDVVNAIL